MTETTEQQDVQSAEPLSEIRFGVLGTGRVTRRLVADLQQTPGVRVTAISSREAVRARWYADQFGIPHGFAGYESLLQSDAIDAVYIALPPSLHLEWALAAAAHYKHVFCEKPLVTSYEQALQLSAACRSANVRWLDATAWLHHPRTVEMAARVTNGELGKLRHVSTAVSFFEPFQSGDHRLQNDLGGGCLLDLGWYAGGALLWATGGELPDRVMAQAVKQREIDYRVSACCLREGSWSATVHCAYDVATRKWMEVAGDEAAVVCDDFTRPWPNRATRYWVHDRAGAVSSHQVDGDQERSMIEDFCHGVRGRIDLVPWQLQALKTQALLQGMAISLAEQTEVRLAEHGLHATEIVSCD